MDEGWHVAEMILTVQVAKKIRLAAQTLASPCQPDSCARLPSNAGHPWQWPFHPAGSAGMAGLTLALAIYLFAEAVLEFILGFQLRPRRASGWLFVDGVITLILAAMIWRTWPSSTDWALGILVGVSMLFSGISRLMFSMAARNLVTQARTV